MDIEVDVDWVGGEDEGAASMGQSEMAKTPVLLEQMMYPPETPGQNSKVMALPKSEHLCPQHGISCCHLDLS